MKRIDDNDRKWGLSETFRDVYLAQDSAQEQADGWNVVQSRLKTRAIRRKALSYAAALIPAAVLLGIGGSRLLSPTRISSETPVAVAEPPIGAKLEYNITISADSQLIADAATSVAKSPAATVLPMPAATARVEAAGSAEHSSEIAAAELAEGSAIEDSSAHEPGDGLGRPDSVENAEAAVTAETARAADVSRPVESFTDDFAFTDADAQPGRRRRITLGLNGGMASGFDTDSWLQTHADAVIMADASPFDGMYYYTKDINRSKEADYEDAVFEHKMPVATGLTLALGLTDRLYAETGLNYTLLRSDVQMPGSLLIDEQKLHFVGIPLKLYWKAADFERFSLYTGAGGQVEKCLKATVGSETYSEKALQWSLNVSAGAQYALSSRISLYLQPEYSFHLNDTRLKTARTEDHTEFSLRCGLRFSL